jgi:uncharacterized protein (DUF3820 family)
MADYNRRHWQHTKEYVHELNTPTNKVLQPFRMSDGIMSIGKYKGQHLSVVPKHYLNWLLKNYKGLSIGTKQKIKKFI